MNAAHYVAVMSLDGHGDHELIRCDYLDQALLVLKQGSQDEVRVLLGVNHDTGMAWAHVPIG